MQKIMLILGASALSATLATAAVADDRPATSAERAKVAKVLRANGFTSWNSIEYDRDDRRFEVDDARHTNGRYYDVDIRGGAIIRKDPE